MARAFSAVLATLVACAASPALASTTCQVTPQGRLCIAQVDFRTFAQTVYQTQYQTQWCWAASISMLFAYYGHPVAQERIVSETYGAPVNMGAVGSTLAAGLNRTWTDDLGTTFHAELTGAFDADVGLNTLNNQQIATELDQGRPLIVGTAHHAMVLTALEFYETPAGPYVTAVGVFDPWPGQGARGLSAEEFTPIPYGGQLRFLATARVEDGPGPEDEGNDGFMGCSSAEDADAPAPLAAALLLVFAFRGRPRPSGVLLRH